jgi:hypothetical protein
MSLQKTTSSYGWMTEANICLNTIRTVLPNQLIVLYTCMKILLTTYSTSRRVTPRTIRETQNDIGENRGTFLSTIIMIIWFWFYPFPHFSAP